MEEQHAVITLDAPVIRGLYTDFNPRIEWRDRVAIGQYDGVYIHTSFDPRKNLPVIQFVGQLESEVWLNLRTYRTTTQKWVSLIADLRPEQRFIHPFELLQIGRCCPERQRSQWIFTIWRDASGQFWRAELSGTRCNRELSVNPVNPDRRFYAHSLAASSAGKLSSGT